VTANREDRPRRKRRPSKPQTGRRQYGTRRALLSTDGKTVLAVLEGAHITTQDLANVRRCLDMAPNNTRRSLT
jgi:hypothetical protein